MKSNTLKKYSGLNIDITASESGSNIAPSFQIPDGKDKVAVRVAYEDIDADDVTMKLVQSFDGENFNDIENSEVTIDSSKPSHMWNIAGYADGLIIRPSFAGGSATDGTITDIEYLG